MTETAAPETLYGTEAPPPSGKAPGLLEQVLGVFTEPTALFQRLATTPVWAGALALLTALNLLVSVLWALRVDVDAMLRPVFERDGKIPADKIDAIIAIQSKLMLPFSILSGLLALGVICLIMALVYWLVGKSTAEKQPPTFRQAYSATVVSGLVTLPKLLLLAIVCALRNIGGAKPDALSPTSLGFFLAPDNVKLHAFYNTLDLFTFASLFLLYLAIRHTMRLKASGAAICTVITAALLFGLPIWGAR